MRKWVKISEIDARQNKIYGLGFWLWIFLIGLILSPMGSIGKLRNAAYERKIGLEDFIYLNELGVASHYIVIIILQCLAAIIIIPLIIGKHSAFRLASTISIAAVWPIYLLISFIFLNHYPGLVSQQGKGTLEWLLLCAIWIAYIQRSRRVRITFENSILADSNRSDAPKVNINEKSWEHALLEFEGGDRRLGVWAKVFAESNGNESLAKAAYIAYRAPQIQEEFNKEESSASKVLKTAPSATTAYKQNVRPEHLKLSASECYTQGLFTEKNNSGYECIYFTNGQTAIHFAATDSLKIYASEVALQDAILKIKKGIASQPMEDIRAWRNI
jgi:hypothetical protein